MIQDQHISLKRFSGLIFALTLLFFFTSIVYSQSETKYSEDELLIEVLTPFQGKTKVNDLIITEKDWFNKSSEKYKIKELAPIFKNADGRMRNFYKIKFTEKSKIDELLNALKDNIDVIKVWKNQIGEYCSNDTYFNSQWGLTKIQAPQAWNIESGDSTIIVAVLDSGVDLGDPFLAPPLDPHPDLVGNLYNYQLKYGINEVDPDLPPFDEIGHGTHVAGIIGASTNNGIGVAGTAGGGYTGNGIKILVINVGNIVPTESAISSGIYSAVSAGAKVINISSQLVIRVDCGDPENIMEGVGPYPLVKAALENAAANDVVVVGAMGNSGWVLSECANGDKITWVFPAAYPEVISVAATAENDVKYSFSNFASWCDISAPGSNIISTLPRYLDVEPPVGYGEKSGTSMAAPYVSGVAALVRSYAPAANRYMVENILKETTDDISTYNSGYPWSGKIGAGRLNAYNALNLIQDLPGTPSSISLMIVNNHPRISWDDNSEADLKGYKIHVKYEFRNGSDPRFWSYIQNEYYLTENSFDDMNWYSSGSDMAYYKVRAVDIIDNNSPYSSIVSASGGLGKKGDNVNNNKKEYNLSLYPNPFNNQITFNVTLPDQSDINIKIYNIQGQLVKYIEKNNCSPGNYNLKWDATNLNGQSIPTGIYFATTNYSGSIITRKLILLK